MSTNIMIRVDASCEIGFGHISRCIVLAESIGKISKICFISRFMPEEFIQKIIQAGFEFLTLENDNNFDIFKDPQEKMSKLKSIILTELDKYHLKFKDENCTFIKKWPKKKKFVCLACCFKKKRLPNSTYSSYWVDKWCHLFKSSSAV